MTRRSIKWESYEYYFREKSRDWYWMVWIVTIAIAIVCVIFNNTLFAVILVVGVFALTLFAEKPPALIHYEINEQGVIIGKIFYPYSTLQSFGIDIHTREMPKLVIKSKKSFVPLIIIHLIDIDEENIRDFLSGYLPDSGISEPLSHKIAEYLGF